MYLSMLETEADKQSFEKLYTENKQRFYFIAYKILQNETGAEDAVHTGFLKLAEKFAQYRCEPYDNLVKLCGTIVRHEAINIAREYQKMGDFWDRPDWDEDNIPDTAPGILDQLIAQYEIDSLTDAVMQLDEAERELLNLQYGMGLKPKEIAEFLGETSQSVRKRMLRCRNKLAKLLKDWV